MKFAVATIVFQIILIILFATLVKYDPKEAGPGKNSTQGTKIDYYPMFQDVQVMIFVGFGFLMTFLKKYGYSAVGYNFFISALAIQWYMIIRACIGHHGGELKILINMESLVTADFSAAAVLITFGAVLGKVSRLQLLIIAIIEIVMFSVNEFILLDKLKVADAGGSMVIHCFGAYFGLALSFMLKRPQDTDNNPKEGSVYHSDIFAMIGTVFLWMYWPSFNSVLVSPAVDQQRAVINTYLSLVSCCVTTFAISTLINKDRKLDMVHIQNATLAGGVAVGTLANMMIQPWGALLIGFLAAAISVVGYTYVTPFLDEKLHIHDTCGVHNLHGMPAILAGVGGAIAAKVANSENYKNSLESVFQNKDDDTKRAGYQISALLITLAISIVSGAITGFIVKQNVFISPTREQLYDDKDFWELPEIYVNDNETPMIGIEKIEPKQEETASP
ncbi:ammonium transporter Rh type B-like isoform X3 [Xenia sp. Carnegie-2017]|uniref:ammonium transporter Rh type B-like isoform X2 n=1 Tax=Xenia sp. Carnegie-2017 TaxID=2897299 RepID=UPI001F0365DE|nr:ammonium transporter Rh type B-like isoform X2 [Xenia sp. Carnegie-2017]XP_046842711.1 ammonium transporter Rh type B-like isoform X3 [Xenia sp. Carnegie-2017]